MRIMYTNSKRDVYVRLIYRNNYIFNCFCENALGGARWHRVVTFTVQFYFVVNT